MTAYLIRMFGISLALTLGIELAAAFLCGVRSGRGILLVTLVNILTNPLAVMLYWLIRLYLPGLSRMSVQLPLEAAVIVSEALVYSGFSRDERWRIRRPVLLSLAANLCSWLLGVLLGPVL